VLERLSSLPEQQHEPVSSKLAAVLVALFEGEDGTVRVWLTQRAQHLKSHQGTNEWRPREFGGWLPACASGTPVLAVTTAVLVPQQSIHSACLRRRAV